MVISEGEVFKDLHLTPGSTARATWTVPADAPYFDGHFPGLPIFPGVAIVDASLFLLRLRLGVARLNPRGVPSAKFLNPVVPGMRVRLDVAPAAGENVWQVEWSEESSAKPLASLRIQL